MIAYAVMGRTALAVVLATSGLTACSEYMDRKNTLAFSAGNAVQTNVVTHVTDPWPAHARSKDIAFNGERMQRAVERYRCGPPANSGGTSGAGGGIGLTVNVNSGAGSAPSQGTGEAC